MVDDIREQKLAQNCRTRDNFVRDWSLAAEQTFCQSRLTDSLSSTQHYITYPPCLAIIKMQKCNKKISRAQSGPTHSLSSTQHYTYIPFFLAIIKMQQMQQNALEHTFCQSMPADSLSSAQQYTTHPSCLAIIKMQQNAAEQSFCQSRPKDSVSSAQHLFLAIYIFP